MAIRRLGIAAALGVPTALVLSVQAPVQAQTSVSRGTAADLRVLTPLNGEIIGAGSFKLDFSFKSRTAAPITRVELFVDGVRWAGRDLDVPSLGNVLTFDVDGSTLTEGAHTFQVKVLNRLGAWSTTELQVIAQGKGTTPTTDTTPPAAAGRPGAPLLTFRAIPAKKLMGTVEIQLDVKSPLGQNPYVSFYVDKQFKVLRNYPPYSFLFDTTTVANGLHTIEATGYLESSNAATTQRMQVVVDNAGGNTDRTTDIKDLGNSAKSATTTVVPSKPIERTAPQLSTVAGAVSAGVRAAATGLKEIAPTTPAFTGTRTIEPKIAVRTSAAVVKRAVPAAATELRAVMPISKGLTAPAPILGAVSAGRPTTSTPGTTVRAAASIAASSVLKATPLVPHRVSKAAPRATARPLVTSNLNNEFRKKLMVAFDGSEINFDVEPRVEAGVPLAPFRQIFEHTGGQVMWMSDTKTVRALNADREVVIKVGAPSATVNGSSVSMERNSYIDRGRTIVPLSFVGKALDVDVDYDPSTGKLIITSKK